MRHATTMVLILENRAPNSTASKMNRIRTLYNRQCMQQKAAECRKGTQYSGRAHSLAKQRALDAETWQFKLPLHPPPPRSHLHLPHCHLSNQPPVLLLLPPVLVSPPLHAPVDLFQLQ